MAVLMMSLQPQCHGARCNLPSLRPPGEGAKTSRVLFLHVCSRLSMQTDNYKQLHLVFEDILNIYIYIHIYIHTWREKLQSSWPQNFTNSRAVCLQADEETNKAGLWVETSWQITQRWPWCHAASTQNPAAWSCTAISTNWKPKQWAPLHHEDIESIVHCTSHNEKGFKSCQSSQSHQLLFTQCQPSTATKLNKMRKPLPAPCSQGPHYCQI